LSPIVFATRNLHKIQEINEILTGLHKTSPLPPVIGLDEIKCTEEIAETSSTIAGNALQKAEYVSKKYKVDCFAEDTGLEIKALNGAPGVKSARYAGESRDPLKNMNLVLKELQNNATREAQFKTVIALIYAQKTYTFTGIVEGLITHTPRGDRGFGYDPIFQPTGYQYTFAEMTISEKNQISHRYRALRQMIDFFETLR
jgi:XTP/dITP diphosphohydrolase